MERYQGQGEGTSRAIGEAGLSNHTIRVVHTSVSKFTSARDTNALRQPDILTLTLNTTIW